MWEYSFYFILIFCFIVITDLYDYWDTSIILCTEIAKNLNNYDFPKSDYLFMNMGDYHQLLTFLVVKNHL